MHASMCAQLCLTLCNPTDCSPAGSTVHGISQSRILEWIAISSSRDRTQISYTGRQILYHLSHLRSLYICIHMYISEHIHLCVFPFGYISLENPDYYIHPYMIIPFPDSNTLLQLVCFPSF